MSWKDFNADILPNLPPNKNSIVRNWLAVGVVLLIAVPGMMMRGGNDPTGTFTIVFAVGLLITILFIPVLRSKKVQPIGRFTADENTITVTLFNEVPAELQFNVHDIQKFKASIPHKPYTSLKTPWVLYKCNFHIQLEERSLDLLLEYRGIKQQTNLLRLMKEWKAVLKDSSVSTIA